MFRLGTGGRSGRARVLSSGGLVSCLRVALPPQDGEREEGHPDEEEAESKIRKQYLKEAPDKN